MQPNDVLVVDDDLVAGGLATSWARRAGFNAEQATGFEDCLDFLSARGPERAPLAIILDLFMPCTDGFDVMRALAERGCESAIFIMTGANHHFLNMAMEFGRAKGLRVAGSLHKPIDGAVLQLHLEGLRAVRTAGA